MLVEHGDDNAAAHGIEFRLEMDEENRALSSGSSMMAPNSIRNPTCSNWVPIR